MVIMGTLNTIHKQIEAELYKLAGPKSGYVVNLLLCHIGERHLSDYKPHDVVSI